MHVYARTHVHTYVPGAICAICTLSACTAHAPHARACIWVLQVLIAKGHARVEKWMLRAVIQRLSLYRMRTRHFRHLLLSSSRLRARQVGEGEKERGGGFEGSGREVGRKGGREGGREGGKEGRREGVTEARRAESMRQGYEKHES